MKRGLLMHRAFGRILIRFIVVVACAFGCSAAQAAQEGIQIVSSDAHGLLLELHLPAFTLEDVQGPDGSFQQIKLSGWASTAEPGRPKLPVAAALLQAPRSGQISLDILEEDQEVLNGCRIGSVASLRSAEKAEATAARAFGKHA